MHISSIERLTLTSYYDMNLHTPMQDHDGGLEPIMGIELLHAARKQGEALKDILAMKPPGLGSSCAGRGGVGPQGE
jgi:hypothetical protein